MNEYRVEYLVVIDSKEPFCQSAKAFNNLLQAHEDINIEGNILKYKGINVNYEVQFGDISTERQKFFHIWLIYDGLVKNLDIFESLLKSIRNILIKVSGKPPEILWDDISSNLCEQAYPVIHELENFMRKLITKFMLTKVGLGWTKETIPKEVMDSIRNKSTMESQNYLYEIDFIQLSNFLFKAYSTSNVNKLMDKIKNAVSKEDLDFNELKASVPTSNWERYFSSPLVECDSDYLKNRWEKIYDIRCKVAHNKLIKRNEFEELLKISREVKEKLQSAIDNLDKINISQSDRESVAENVAISISNLYADFLNLWKLINENIFKLVFLTAKTNEEKEKLLKARNNWRSLCNFAKRKHILPSNFKTEMTLIAQFRSVIVNHADMVFTEESILSRIDSIKSLNQKIVDIISKVEIDLVSNQPLNFIEEDLTEEDTIEEDTIEEDSFESSN
ncbi:hypothetical protein [Nostoc sp. CALU 1950]|uniref:hypothetical protein n=1 Tax=Nostoc sp. CALU 1950 TaxID=3104321 RepID=UPI003EBFBA34